MADPKAYAASVGLPVHQVDLDAQFRCDGSRKDVGWVQLLLRLSPGDPIHGMWTTTSRSVSPGPSAMEAALAAQLQARLAADYCWKWSAPRADQTLVPDVTIGDWQRPWNLKGDPALPGAPPAALWASEPTGFGQLLRQGV